MPRIPYFISRTCLSLSTTTRARTTNYSSACSLSGIPWDRTFFFYSGHLWFVLCSQVFFGDVTMGVYFAVRIPSGLCVATSCMVSFLFRLGEYLYEGHIFLAPYGPFARLLHKSFCFTQPPSTIASFLCQTKSLVRERICTTLNLF